MNKRLRKKKRVGEFAEYGFHMAFRVDQSTTESAWDDLGDRFIEMIEATRLQFGGGYGGDDLEGFVEAERPRASVTDEQRSRVRSWCADEPAVLSYYVGPLVDAWHGDFDEAIDDASWTTK